MKLKDITVDATTDVRGINARRRVLGMPLLGEQTRGPLVQLFVWKAERWALEEERNFLTPGMLQPVRDQPGERWQLEITDEAGRKGTFGNAEVHAMAGIRG